MNPYEIDGRRVVLLLILEDETGKVTEDGHAYRVGDAHWDSETLWLDWGPGEQPYAVDPEYFERFKRLPAGVMADETGAELYFALSVGILPEGGETSGEYRPLGWRMPDPSSENDADPEPPVAT